MINLGTGVEVSIAEVVERVLKLLQLDVPVDIDDDRLRPPEVRSSGLWPGSPRRRRARLGSANRPGRGMGLTIDWLTSSLGDYKPTIYNV